MVLDPEVPGGEVSPFGTRGRRSNARVKGRKRRGSLLRRAAQGRALRRAKGKRAARGAKGARAAGRSGAGRLLGRAGPSAIVIAMIIAAIRLQSGKTLQQMGQAAKNFAAGELLLKAAAARMAQTELFSSMNFTAFELEGQRADKAQAALGKHQALLHDGEGGLSELGMAAEMSGHTGTTPEVQEWMNRNRDLGIQSQNRSVHDHKIVFDKILKDKVLLVRGFQDFLMMKEFASQSDLDLLILRGGEAIEGAKLLMNKLLKWAKGL